MITYLYIGEDECIDENVLGEKESNYVVNKGIHKEDVKEDTHKKRTI